MEMIKLYSADLHIHSTASDGLLSTTEIINWGLKKNLKAISITDHDNVSGIESAVNYSMSKGIEVIPGVELSTEFQNVEIHILGYYIDYKDDFLNSFLDNLKESRIKRAEQMVKKIKSLGYGIKFEDVCEVAKDASSIGRPHIARVMVNYGYSKSIEDAFANFIGFGKPGYVERYKISPFQAVEVIKKSGGVSSIAHPGLIVNLDKYLLIKKLKDWGLSGIEVYHTRHTKQDAAYYLEIANKLELVPTGGSDCHGVLVNNEPIMGSVTVSYENVLMLKEYRDRSAKE